MTIGTVQPVPTVSWGGDAVVLIDQRLLPGRTVFLRCRTVARLADAITTLAVRGAPAIGIAAGYGAVLAALEAPRGRGFRAAVSRGLDLLARTRPTAVNLFHAIEVQRGVLASCRSRDQAVEALLASARRMHEEDLEASRTIGRLGAGLLPGGARVLTHCNAGGLATGGLGTALAILFEAHSRGLLERVYADETRPLLQGSRLTAWELSRAGIPVTVLPDSAAASLLSSGAVDAVVTGADRIARNGDTANKIGTYPLALAAAEAGVPFYIAAPVSTFDPHCPDGSSIPVEMRGGDEIRRLGRRILAPPRAEVHNPAFDVTPARLVSAVILETGIAFPPLSRSLSKLTAQSVGTTFGRV